MGSEKRAVGFLFGNHKHWTGMVWEWGEDTLSNSTWALKRILDETQLKAGLNFDGRGLEHLAVTEPETLSWMREALKERALELWGGTYTQPYGGLIGHESNVRQRIYGIRAMERLLGQRPRVFCEEEFDCFPQLPQLLKQLNYEAALMFPQHTWHTPTVPHCSEPVVLWTGVDGSEIPTVPLSDRCLMRGIPTALSTIANLQQSDPLVITWLEMLDKPNWMWRTEFVLPYLRSLLEHNEIEVKPRLILEEIAKHDRTPPRQTYTLDNTFHGVSVSKNGDMLPRLWRRGENAILRAEFLAAWCSFLGQPYPQFDSYPEWQLEEAWRMLLQSQGHDAYECEGLTNFAGHRYAQMALMLAQDVTRRCEHHLAERLAIEPPAPSPPPVQTVGDGLEARVGDAIARIRESDGALTFLGTESENLLAAPVGLPTGWGASGPAKIAEFLDALVVTTEIVGPDGATGTLKWTLEGELAAVKGQLTIRLAAKLPEGILGGIRLPIRFPRSVKRWRVDSPFAVVDIQPNGEWLHRQPEGHWLTSPQRDEWIPNPIVHNELIAAEWDASGLLFVSSQNSLALACDDGFDEILFSCDAWDGNNWNRQATIDFGLAPLRSPTSLELLTLSRRILWGAHPPFAYRGRHLFELVGNAHITCVRKVVEDLEIRLFETEGADASVTLDFPWDVESARLVDPLGEPAAGDVSWSGRGVSLDLAPRQIATLRILFRDLRTEYLDIDSHRSIWVGPNP